MAQVDPVASGSDPEKRARDLKEAETKFQEALQLKSANQFEDAIRLLSEVLDVKVKYHGELGFECASAYFHYGASLFYKAQDQSDVFGAPLKQAARDKDQLDADAPVVAADEKGKGPAVAPAEGAAEGLLPTDSDDEEEEEENEQPGEEGAEDADNSDWALAWEVLDVARKIYADNKDREPIQLAVTHSLLGEVSMEQEQFQQAEEDLQAALALFKEHAKEGDRRIPEAYFKLSMVQHFLDKPEDALESVNQAVTGLQSRKQHLLQEQGSSSAPSTAAEELKDVDSVLDELTDKVEELEGIIKERNNERAAMKKMFGDVLASAGLTPQAGTSGGPSTSSQAPSTAAKGPTDLGIVGRGKKKLTLAPMPAGTNTAVSTGNVSKPTRSLEDLMGGSGGETTIGFAEPTKPDGFGTGIALSKNVASIAAQPEAKRAKLEPVASNSTDKPAALPAFLQPQAIADTYKPGALPEPAEGTAPSAECKAALPAFLQPQNVTAVYSKLATEGNENAAGQQ